MKILLVKPYSFGDHIQPPLGLGYLATALRKENDVKIIDCLKEGLDNNGLLEEILRFRPNLLGVQLYTSNIKTVKDILSKTKNLNKNIITVVGGPHPSSCSDSILTLFGNLLDYAFSGEAEKGFPLLIKKIENKIQNLDDIPGLVWRNNDKTVTNEKYLEKNLDSLSMVAWDLIKPEEYPESQHGAFYKNFPIAPIIATRGCPYKCSFCAGFNITGRKIRSRGIEHVLSEIKFLYYNHSIREIHIVDDNFTLNKKYAKKFCEELIALGLDLSWATPNGVRLDSLDTELLRLMKKSGLYIISLGIESGSERILQSTIKHLNLAKIKEKVKLIRKEEIDIAAFFVLGFPGESKEEIKKTIDLSLELDLIRANYFTFLPFPGTKSYSDLLKSDELENVDWDHFYFTSAPYSPKNISHKELRHYQKMAFMKFYLRPKIIFKNLIQIKSMKHFKFLCKRFYHWLVRTA